MPLVPCMRLVNCPNQPVCAPGGSASSIVFLLNSFHGYGLPQSDRQRDHDERRENPGP